MEINTIIQQECIIFVKSDSKDNVTKDSHFKEMLFFSTFQHHWILKTNLSQFPQKS